MNIKATIVGSLAVLAAFAVISEPVSAKTNFLVHIFAPPQYPNNSHGWKYLKENVERDTQGRVTF